MLPDFLMHRILTIRRTLLTSGLLAATVCAAQIVTPASAMAEESQCTNGGVLMSAPVWAFSELVSADFAGSGEFLVEQKPTNEAQEISWCTSPDDPRCSPLLPENDPTTRTLVGSTVVATLPAQPKIFAPGSECVQFVPEQFVVSPGFNERLDRPPRV